MVFADLDESRRSKKYRATIFDTAPPPVELASVLVAESETTFTGLPAGAFAVVITATNKAGESQLGEAVGSVLV